MKNILISLIFTVFLPIFLTSCAGTNARESLSWAGCYSGTIPAANGQGINVKLTLNADNTYSLIYDYIDKINTFKEEGTFYRYKASNFIVLLDSKYPKYYKISDGHLLQLDMEGHIITGDHADQYVFEKKIN